jgi:hypothetical protein
VGTETDPMGSTRPDMNWHTTQGDRDNNNIYPDDRYPSRYPSSMPGRYPYERPGMYPGDYGKFVKLYLNLSNYNLTNR